MAAKPNVIYGYQHQMVVTSGAALCDYLGVADYRDAGEWLRGVLPGRSGMVRVRLSPDIGVDLPVEVEELAGPSFRADVALVGLKEGDVDGIFGYVSPEMLGISPSLTTDLREFQRWWEEHSDLFGDAVDEELEASEEDPEWRQWEAEGRRLVVRLQNELGARYTVAWQDVSPP